MQINFAFSCTIQKKDVFRHAPSLNIILGGFPPSLRSRHAVHTQLPHYFLQSKRFALPMIQWSRVSVYVYASDDSMVSR